MMEKVITLLEAKPIICPKFLFENYKKLKIDDSELIVLIYLLNKSDTMYNPVELKTNLHMDLPEALSICESLKSKDIIKIETKKINNRIEEHISFIELYKKLSLLIVNKEEEKNNTNIFDIFEKEFGRTLSGYEYEIINAWLTSGDFSEELILSALKEATYNGVSNLRYIDKILYEWNKKGIKTKDDALENRKRFTKTKEKVETVELYEYDWLNED